MLAGWTDVDVRATDVAVLEQRKPFDDSAARYAVETGKHSRGHLERLHRRAVLRSLRACCELSVSVLSIVFASEMSLE